jgi:energy-coupling factor transporter ATP-binding protein EcfA2
MEHQITVKKFLSDKKDQILEIIAKTISDKGKIHIDAPVGSGKTTLILELIQLYPDKQFIILFPQISITEQVKTKLTALNIESSEVNAKTVERVIEKNSVSQSISLDKDKSTSPGEPDKVFLTTIDSAYKLIENLKFVSGKTVVVLDETHTFLTSARNDHTRSVEAILNNGFPIVGFSATPSNWVNRMLFGIDNSIKVNTTKTKNPVVTQILVQNSAIRTLAYKIAEENKKLTVVFTETIKAQEEIQERIKEYNPKIKVRCLNANSKTSTEKDTWDYLMKKDKLKTGTNVFILNSVVQSGININNRSIDTVYLFGTFDPFGFAQYLGRCRNYKKNFKYYHSPYSKQPELFNGANAIQLRIDWMTKLLELSSDEFAQEIKIVMSPMSYKDADQNLVVNKCTVARSFFKELTNLSGDTLTDIVSSLFKDIKFEEPILIGGELASSAKSKANSRAKGKTDLVEFIKNEYTLLTNLFAVMNYDYSEANLIKIIKSKDHGKLTLLKQQSDKMNKMVDLMKEAQITPHRLSTAAYFYRKSGKSDEVLEELISMSNNTTKAISGAIKYFDKFPKSGPTIKKAINNLKGYVGDTNSAKEWKNIVHRELSFLNMLPGVSDDFYKFCLQTKRSNGQFKLIQINTSVNNYIEGLGLEHITVVNGKIAPK